MTGGEIGRDQPEEKRGEGKIEGFGDPAHVIDDLRALHAHYGTPGAASMTKEVPRLTAAYRRWIEAAPFFAIASVGADGLDVSPRGDAPGQVLEIIDDTTLLIPDRRGNNRLDTLRNIVVDPRIALLFFVPGANETVRVNGRALISADPALLGRFVVAGKAPATVLVVTIDAAYFQCARALVRSALWSRAGDQAGGAASVPSAGQMLAAVDADFDGSTYDAELAARQQRTLY